jgi:DNA-binding XRE family transcriptional regulator
VQHRIRELRAERGWSQQELAHRLGMSRQAVTAIETGKSDPSLTTAFRLAWLFERPVEEVFAADVEEKMAFLNASWQYQDRMATAFDEVGVLDEMGREGWEMTGFGPLVLHFRRPEDPNLRMPWAYERVTELGTPRRRAQLEQDGWTYCGSWMNTYHYFKRAERFAEASRP